MSQRTTGIYRLVTLPWFFRAFQSSVGAGKFSRRWVDEILGAGPGRKILDVGCGPADILAYLPSPDYTGIDLNQKHIDFARRRYGNRGRFIVGDAIAELNKRGDSFDIITATGLLHHLSDEQCKSMFLDLRRLLKPDGRICTIDNVWLPAQRGAVRMMNLLDSGKNIRTPDGYRHLFDGLNLQIESRIYNNLLRIPYDHFCMRH